MEFQQVERGPAAFQRPLAASEVQAVIRRAFGEDAQVVLAVELGAGMYKTPTGCRLRAKNGR